MKKSLLLSAAVLLLGSSAFARQWDFTSWSSTTVGNVIADELWTGDEKGNGTVFEGAYWYKATSLEAACDENGNLKANGAVIAETEGLKFTVYGSGYIAIATDYQTTKDSNTWGPYNGPQYFWLAGGNKVRITIPGVKPGTEISAGLESHNPSNARGIDLYVNDTKIAFASGQSGYPTTYDEYTWIVPEELEDETVDVEIRPSSGCHLYFIKVDEGDTTPEEINIGYLYDSSYYTSTPGYGYGTNGGLDADPIYTTLMSHNVTAIDLSSEQTLSTTELNDSLTKFDVVVLSEAVSSGNNYAKAVKDIINFVPMLNLKAFMYKNWGFGAGDNPSPKATTITFGEDYLDSELGTKLLANVNAEEGNVVMFECEDVTTLAGGNLVQGYIVKEGTLFADDEVYAKVGDINAIHTHGTKNQYMLIPVSSDNLTMLTEDAMLLIQNAVEHLATTKSKVQNAATPVISQAKANMQTTVSIACSTVGSTIYYTTDGTDPTEASTVYSEPFVVTENGLVVKAFAVAHGYNNSDVATATIDVLGQAAAPRISVVESEGFSTITLSADEGASIYYSFNGITTASDAALYAEPVVITEPATVYAFVAGDGVLPSDLVSFDVRVGGIPSVKDTVAHFTANETDWFTNVAFYNYNMEVQETPASNWAAKAAYYWGKSAWNYYGTEIDHTEPVYEEDGKTPVKCADGVTDSIKTVYKADPTAVKYVYSTTDPQWRLASQGQLFTGETNVAATYAIGDPTALVYNAQSAQDLIGEPSKGKMTFGGKVSGDPYSAKIESTQKFQAPFDVVTYVTNGGGSAFVLEVQVSADGENWTVLDTVNVANLQRRYCKTRMHYDGTDEVYVRMAHVSGSTKAQVYDIYVITTGEKTGIEAIEMNEAQNADKRIYDLQGRRVATMQPGRIYLQNGKKVMTK